MNRTSWVAGLAAAPLALIACGASEPVVPSHVAQTDGYQTLVGTDARAFRMPSDVVQVTSFGVPAKGFTYERFQQMFGPARVAGAQVTVQKGPTGDVDVVTGSHFDAIAPSNTVVLTQADAIAIAQQALPEATTRTAILMIDPSDGRYYYAVDSLGDALRYAHWVDAQTGAIFNQFDALTGGCTYNPGGLTFLNEQVDLAGKVTAGALATARQVTRDLGSQKKPFYGTADKDSNGCWDAPGRTSPGQGALVSAHLGVMAADTYYRNTYGFDLASHTGGTLTVWAHQGVNYNNAYWDGTKMVFGDGDGVKYREFTANDVAAHEISHGITEFTSNLVYQGESGALNESFSDIMGFTIGDPSDWLMGEDVTYDGKGFRDMADPTTHGDPATYCDRYTGTSDNGGVHTNSSISNRAFYLVASQIGVTPAADIFYKAFTGLTDTNATFLKARQATEAQAVLADAAAPAETPLGALAAVQAAWDTVRVSATETCGAPAPQCTASTDCPADSDPCTSATCTAGVCGQADNGTCGPTCTASGGSCTSNSQCCSNTCRTSGKRANTCT